jgi:hypothetical protein
MTIASRLSLKDDLLFDPGISVIPRARLDAITE